VAGTVCDIGFDLRENVNRVDIESCSITDFAQYAVKLAQGTTGFGKIALVFNNCDFEYGAGVCVYSFTPDLIAFNDCYIGEGCDSSVFQIVTGNMVVNGGLVFYGDAAAGANRLVEFVGTNPTTDERSLLIQNAKIAPAGADGVPNAENLVKGDGALYIENCNFASQPFWNGSAILVTGDKLGKTTGFSALSSPFGLGFTPAVTGTATITSTPALTTGALFVQCTATGGPSDILTLTSPLDTGALQTFGTASYIVTYKSNTAFNIELIVGATKTTAVVLPSTSNTLQTLVCYNQIPLSAAYTSLVISKVNPQTSDFIEITDAYVFDNRQAGSAGTLYVLKNLYKPI
jgi:hypothetical protein